MSNSIDGMGGANNAANAKRLQQAQQTKVNGAAANKQEKNSGDIVSLTDTAENLRTLAQNLASTPEINREKVEAVKQALASGSYQLDPVQVAKKFIEIEKALGQV